MPFTILPAFHLDGGRLRETPGRPPAEVLGEAARRFEEAVAVDVTGLRRNEPEIEILQAAARNRLVWMDAGSRTVEDLMDLYVAGASRVTARWSALAGEDELEEALELAESLYLGLEVSGLFVKNPRAPLPAATLARRLEGSGAGLVVIDLAAADGAPSPLALETARGTIATVETWYMGAIGADAARALEKDGFAGAIVPIETAEAARSGAP